MSRCSKTPSPPRLQPPSGELLESSNQSFATLDTVLESTNGFAAPIPCLLRYRRNFDGRAVQTTWESVHESVWHGREMGELVCEVPFAEWISDFQMRQTIFPEFRPDKNPKEVVLEQDPVTDIVLEGGRSAMVEALRDYAKNKKMRGYSLLLHGKKEVITTLFAKTKVVIATQIKIERRL